MERSAALPRFWVAAFLAIVYLRNLLELFSAGNPVYGPAQFFLHYPLAYLGPFLALSLLLAAGSGERIERVGRLMVLVWVLTLLPPILRLPGATGAENTIFYGIPVDRLGYSMPMEGADYLRRVLFFFSPFHRFSGTTVGIRLETLLACLLTIGYVRIKGKGWARAAATAAGVYLTALFFFHLPMLFYSFGRFLQPGTAFTDFYWGEGLLSRGDSAERHVPICVFYLTALCGLLGLAWAWRHDRRAAAAALRRHAGTGLTLLLFAGITGLLFGQVLFEPAAAGRRPVPYDGLAVFSILAALACAGAAFPGWRPLSGIGPGGGADPAPERPAWIASLAAAALLFAWVGGTAPATVLIALLGCRALFCAPPFRLAATPPFAALGWALASLLAGTVGLSLFLGPESIPLFPRSLLLLPLLGYLPGLLAADIAGSPRLRPAAFILAIAAAATTGALLGATGPVWALLVPAGLLLGAAAWLPSGPNRFLPATAPAVLGVLLLVSAPVDYLAAVRQASYSSPRFHSRRAQRLEADGDLAGARAARQRAVDLAPDDPMAHYDLGVILARLGEADGAAAAFAESVRIDPTFAEAAENLGRIHLALGKPEAARGPLEEAVREWERRLAGGELPAVGRRLARDKITELRTLLDAAASSGQSPDRSR